MYDGILAKRLKQDDIGMSEQCLKVLGKKSPHSWVRGSSPITGVFATSGLNCTNIFQSAHGYGVGDHRVFVIDVDLSSLIGEDVPKLIRQPGRTLQAKKRSTCKAYNRRVRKNVIRHRLIEK